MTATVVVYVLAALTIFAILRAHVIERMHADLLVVFAAIVAVLWPIIVPWLLVDAVTDWFAAKKGGR